MAEEGATPHAVRMSLLARGMGYPLRPYPSSRVTPKASAKQVKKVRRTAP